MIIPAGASVALPTVRSLAECADYKHVVEPFIPQLYALPRQIAAQITNPAALRTIYLSTNPVISGFAFSLALFPIFLVVSEVNRNWSQVDRVWSILPSVYHVHYAVWARLNGLPTSKIDNVLVFSLIWTTRLTYNYWRRGGYNIGSEDYRWNLIKGWIGTPAFFLLNVLFTSSIQSVSCRYRPWTALTILKVLLFLVTTPAYLILVTSLVKPEMSFIDQVFAKLLIGLVALEWFADGAQWRYYEAKHAYQKTGTVQKGYIRAQLERGFNTTGLFKYSRHPNFAAEQSIWVFIYVWGCVATLSFYNWTIAGPISYLLVFAGSTPLTEYISSSKYPEYKIYQQRVGRFLPKFFGKGWSEEEMAVLGPKVAQEAKSKKSQ